MAISSTPKKLVLVILLLSFWPLPYTNAKLLKTCHFDKIYQLGDSISDTGNLVRETVGASTGYAKLPYGQTTFKRATGRCSNGLLMIDYIAMDAGLPFLAPYKKTHANFAHGVNFAVAGATALPWNVLAAHHIYPPITNSSLSVQLEWLSTHLNSTCLREKNCGVELQNVLFMVGEIGGNDYNYGFLQGKKVEELRSIVPLVVDAIVAGVRKVISFGATTLVVPGNFPIGCLPMYQSIFESSISAAYDENQCVKQLNDFAKYHNKLLQQAIQKLKQERPDVTIIYGDYFNAYQFLHRFAKSHGFETQKACCGIGGKYRFNMTRQCGEPNVPICSNPHRFISWDGAHLTQEGYKIMANWLLRSIFSQLNCHL